MYKGMMRRCKLVILWTILFVFLTGISMISYPGGSLIDKLSIHYNFFENYFSSLGSTMTVSGKSNKVSNILFTIAVSGLGLILVYFSKIWRIMDLDAQKNVILGYISKTALILSGLSFIGIAFAPWDLYFDNHVLFMKLSFVFLLIWVLLIIFLQSGNKKIRNLFVLNIIYFLFLSAYLIILFEGPKFGTTDDLKFQVISQMLVFYVTVVNLAVQALGLIRFLKTSDFRSRGLKNFYV